MTVEFYEEMAEVAVELLEEFGDDLTLVRETAGVRNPVTGEWTTPPTSENIVVRGVVTQFPKNVVGTGEGNNRVSITDRRIVIDGRKQPLISDKIAGWSIINITEVKPTSVPVAYFIHVRR